MSIDAGDEVEEEDDAAALEVVGWKGCGVFALSALAASQAVRVEWSTGHFSAPGGGVLEEAVGGLVDGTEGPDEDGRVEGPASAGGVLVNGHMLSMITVLYVEQMFKLTNQISEISDEPSDREFPLIWDGSNSNLDWKEK